MLTMWHNRNEIDSNDFFCRCKQIYQTIWRHNSYMENPEYTKFIEFNRRLRMSVNGSRDGIEIHQLLPKMLCNTSRVSTFNFKVSEWRGQQKKSSHSSIYSTTEIKAGLIKSIQHLTCAQWIDDAQWIVMRTQFVCSISRVQLKSLRSLLSTVKGDVDYNWNINQSRNLTVIF